MAPATTAAALLIASYVATDEYFGTAEQLVQHGVVPTIAMFPGQPGVRRKICASYASDGLPIRPGFKTRLQIRKHGRDSFKVYWKPDAAEVARREMKYPRGKREPLAPRGNVTPEINQELLDAAKELVEQIKTGRVKSVFIIKDSLPGDSRWHLWGFGREGRDLHLWRNLLRAYLQKVDGAIDDDHDDG